MNHVNHFNLLFVEMSNDHGINDANGGGLEAGLCHDMVVMLVGVNYIC